MEKHSMRQPRVAVYVCGQWRGSSYACSTYLNKIFENYNCDFFIHTSDFYEGKEIFQNLPDSINHKISFINELNCNYHTETDVTRMKQCYPNVVYFDMESKEKNNQIGRDFGARVGLSSFNQFYCANKCNEYRKIYENMNGFRYDIVIKIRPDIIFPENHIKSIFHYINMIQNDKLLIFSKYSNDIVDIKRNPPQNLVWDYYTFSSPFGMDCMMEWVKDILDGNRVFSSDYILKYNLNPNTNNKVEMPNPFIVRELFKFFDLNYFFQEEFVNEYSSNYKKTLVHSVNKILYLQNTTSKNVELFYDFYDIYNKLIDIFDVDNIVLEHLYPKPMYFSELQLKEFAHYLQSKQDEYETRINNL